MNGILCPWEILKIKRVLGPRVRTHKLNENSDDDFEPRTDLNQPVGGLPV
jgi:hypothetical protein